MVAATTVSPVAGITPKRNPPASVMTVAPGSENATTAT